MFDCCKSITVHLPAKKISRNLADDTFICEVNYCPQVNNWINQHNLNYSSLKRGKGDCLAFLRVNILCTTIQLDFKKILGCIIGYRFYSIGLWRLSFSLKIWTELSHALNLHRFYGTCSFKRSPHQGLGSYSFPTTLMVVYHFS